MNETENGTPALPNQGEEQTKKNLPIKQYPNSYEAEQYMLCCILIDAEVANKMIPEMRDTYFFNRRNQAIFAACTKLFNAGKGVDVITVNDCMEKEKLAEPDTMDYLVELNGLLPSAVNYKEYKEILYRDMVLRKLINIGKEIINDAYESSSAEASLANAEKLIYGVGSELSTGGLEHISRASGSLMKRLDEMLKDKTSRKGLLTHFNLLDRLTNGLQPSSLIILAARPSVGKTSFALNIVSNIIANHEKETVIALFSLEMPAEQLAQRILSSLTDVSMTAITQANLNEKAQDDLWDAHIRASECQVFLDDTSMQTPGNVASKCRRLKAQHKRLDLVIIDYLQLMGNDKEKMRRNDSKQNDVSEISRMMKILAMDLRCPVVVLSQMSRSIEGRDDKVPRLSDLRESGAIEQDADMVMFLSREDENEKDKEQYNVILNIAKHRNGALNSFRLVWRGANVTFTESENQKVNLEFIGGNTAKKKKPTED